MTDQLVPKTYLGDSVYAEHDCCGIILTTDNGYGASNTIYLEYPQVIDALARYVKALKVVVNAPAETIDEAQPA